MSTEMACAPARWNSATGTSGGAAVHHAGRHVQRHAARRPDGSRPLPPRPRAPSRNPTASGSAAASTAGRDGSSSCSTRRAPRAAAWPASRHVRSAGHPPATAAISRTAPGSETARCAVDQFDRRGQGQRPAACTLNTRRGLAASARRRPGRGPEVAGPAQVTTRPRGEPPARRLQLHGQVGQQARPRVRSCPRRPRGREVRAGEAGRRARSKTSFAASIGSVPGNEPEPGGGTRAATGHAHQSGGRRTQR